ncbi:MAG: 6,7-dimethyl-8-ribityllumazine synthase [bacterium]
MNRERSKAELPKRAAKGVSIAIVVSRFNEEITSQLLEDALKCLSHYGCRRIDNDVFFCPGAFELPQVANRLCAKKQWDAIICLGAVIRGETPHFEYVSSETARGLQHVALKFAIPIVFGVLTTNTIQQARERAGGKHGHKGWDAAVTALEMVALFRTISRTGKTHAG